MIFILVARHRRTKEVAAWSVERDTLWQAMRERHDIEPPTTLAPEWIAECDIALMMPGTIYSGHLWDDIRSANEGALHSR